MMKKFTVLLSLLFVLALVGCAPSALTASPTEAATSHILTKEEVKELVFTHARVNAADVLNLEVDLDEEAGAIFYDLEFDHQKTEHDYRVDAHSGEILYNNAEPIETKPVEEKPVETEPAEQPPTETKPAEEKPTETTPATTTQKKIGVNAAKNAAFEHAKVKASDAWDVEVDLDTENGKLVYEVSFNVDRYDYEYEIDAYSGKVLRSEKELDD